MEEEEEEMKMQTTTRGTKRTPLSSTESYVPQRGLSVREDFADGDEGMTDLELCLEVEAIEAFIKLGQRRDGVKAKTGKHKNAH